MNLEAIKKQKAKLPETYQQAQQSLAKCDRIDECKDWADKASALASYAKQADDDQLENFAKRIRIRALRRCGELLKAIEKGRGGRPSKTGGDAPTSLTRRQAAQNAGMSKDQQMTATNIASIDSDQFESLTDSDNPPTITDLAEIGKNKKVFTKEQINFVKVRRNLLYVCGVLDEFDLLKFPEELSALSDDSEYDFASTLDELINYLIEVKKCIQTRI